MKKLSVLILFALSVCACDTFQSTDYYNAPSTSQAQTASATQVWKNGHPDDAVVQKTVEEPFDTLWPVVLQYVSDEGYPLSSVDRKSGSIISDYKTSSKNIDYWAKCDYSISYTQYRSKMSVLLVKNGDKTTIRPTARFEAYNKNLGWVPCYSNGAAENGVFYRIINRKGDGVLANLEKSKQELQEMQKKLSEISY